MAFHLLNCCALFLRRLTLFTVSFFPQHRKLRNLPILVWGCSASSSRFPVRLMSSRICDEPPRKRRRPPCVNPAPSTAPPAPLLFCAFAAFRSCTTRFRARCNMMLYNTMISSKGSRPIAVVSRISAGGAIRMNQQIFPSSVSPLQPITGRKPTIKPSKRAKSVNEVIK